MDKKFYVYIWYKKDEPVYVGKGCGRRAYRNSAVDVEIVRNNLTEQQAFELEQQLIDQIGRADLGEGPLMNLTAGGGIAFSTLYWAGEELKQRHAEGIKRRSENEQWTKEASERARHATKTRSRDWQDSVYLIRDPNGSLYELKTQQLKDFCDQRALKFDQMKHIARGNITKRKNSPHYGYLVEVLYNKVTKATQNRDEVEQRWRSLAITSELTYEPN